MTRTTMMLVVGLAGVAGPGLGQTAPHIRFGVVADRPAGVVSAAESWWRLGAERRVGAARVVAGSAGVVSIPGQDLSLGSFASARIAVGRLELIGEVGQLLSMSGSPALGSRLGADTGVRTGRGVRSLLHGQLVGNFQRDRLHLGARLLRRTRVTPYDGLGWEASVGVEVMAGAMVRLAVGRAPIGPSVYLPFRRAATIGIEVVPRRPRRAPDVTPARDRLAAEPAEDAAFDWVVEAAPDTVLFRVRHPGAALVEIAGDFTDWRPVGLRRVGNGVWEVRLPVPSGLHLMSLRIDGGPFEAPPGLEAAADGFGGRAGVVVVDRSVDPS